MASPAIRPLRLEDAGDLAALVARNRDFLRPFEPERDERFFTAEGQRERAQQALAAAQAGVHFPYVILDGDGQVAGGAALEHVIGGASQSATVSYWVDEARNGRGLASRAVAELIGFAAAELRLHRLQAPVRVDNLASQRVLEKNGFEPIGVARSYLLVGGEWRDHVLLQRLLD